MSESPNITLIKRLYESGMAPEVTAEVMAEDLVWDITPGFPYGGVYHGWSSAGSDFFGRLAPNFEAFGAVPEEYFADDAGHVFVYGHYHGKAKTGNEVDARFVHLWTVRDGKAVQLRQAADSHLIHEALKG
ncbi:nuclear transport factor 2 family protein [Streptomyces sp. NPDC088760]|uniref:nuclear transport factor 2 family protein n=1 Tax=Streptomyces sp. NPDC088760 TaxID=3365890 RepID=UPI0037F40B29